MERISTRLNASSSSHSTSSVASSPHGAKETKKRVGSSWPPRLLPSPLEFTKVDSRSVTGTCNLQLGDSQGACRQWEWWVAGIDVRNRRVADADAREFGTCISFSRLVLVMVGDWRLPFRISERCPVLSALGRAGTSHIPTHPGFLVTWKRGLLEEPARPLHSTRVFKLSVSSPKLLRVVFRT